jgi:putative ABC transport system substrate-binding protein
MRRRQFIAVLSGAALWPCSARAQQTERVRRIGVLMPHTQDNPVGPPRIAALLQELQQLGWVVGRNTEIDVRWAGPNAEDLRRHAVELVARAPDVILANGNIAVAHLLQATRTVPIVFVIVPDPVGGGFVDSLARPGGNATGFLQFEYGLSAKWLEMLKQIAPSVTRAAIMRDSTSSGTGQFGAIQSVAPSVGIEVKPLSMRNASEIERDIAAFARVSNGGLIVTGSGLAQLYRDLIINLAARHKLPAVYFDRFFITAGGLISYGPELVDQFRLAASYVNRVLKGEKPADLPVQAPTKYELVINLRTAKTLGIDVPPTLLARAAEVI